MHVWCWKLLSTGIKQRTVVGPRDATTLTLAHSQTYGRLLVPCGGPTVKKPPTKKPVLIESNIELLPEKGVRTVVSFQLKVLLVALHCCSKPVNGARQWRVGTTPTITPPRKTHDLVEQSHLWFLLYLFGSLVQSRHTAKTTSTTATTTCPERPALHLASCSSSNSSNRPLKH